MYLITDARRMQEILRKAAKIEACRVLKNVSCKPVARHIRSGPVNTVETIDERLRENKLAFRGVNGENV